MIENSDRVLWKLVKTIVAGDAPGAASLLAESPELAIRSFQAEATRPHWTSHFIDEIRKQVYRGDTALHIAAAAYQTEIVRSLIRLGAGVRARNRMGVEPLHAAAIGGPGSAFWNPAAQSSTIVCLIEAGADPNAGDKLGATPLHKAVRTRCAAAVQTLLEHGTDPSLKNKSGSIPLVLAHWNTGRPGSGSSEAKAQQREILRLLSARA